MTEKKYQDLLEKRHSLDNDIQNLEKQIYDLETRYLEETANTGFQMCFLNEQQGTSQKVGMPTSKIKITKRLNNKENRKQTQTIDYSPQVVQPLPFNNKQMRQLMNEPMEQIRLLIPLDPRELRRIRTTLGWGKVNNSKSRLELNEMESSDSSEDYQGGIKKKIKGIKKY